MSEFIRNLSTETLRELETEAQEQGINDALSLVQGELARRALADLGFYDASEDHYDVTEHNDERWGK